MILLEKQFFLYTPDIGNNSTLLALFLQVRKPANNLKIQVPWGGIFYELI